MQGDNKTYTEKATQLHAQVRKLAAELLHMRQELVDQPVVVGRLDNAVQRLRSLDKRVKAHEIKIVGHMRVGKSSLTSALLGLELPRGNVHGNATTAVATEIRSDLSQRDFSACVTFLSESDVRAKLKEHARSAIPMDPGVKPAKDSAWRSRCSLFEQVFEELPVAPAQGPPMALELSQGPLAALVGRGPLVLRSETPEGLSAQLEPYLRLRAQQIEEDSSEEAEEAEARPGEPHPLTALLVSRVVIEGPFEHLPSSVVITDLPGLGDRIEARAQRALDEFRLGDEVWFLCHAVRGLHEAHQAAYVNMVIGGEAAYEQLVVVGATQLDRIDDDSSLEVRDAELSKLWKKDLKMLLRKGAREGREEEEGERRPLTRQEKEEINARLARISVVATSLRANKVPYGLEAWQSRLRERDVVQVQVLEESARQLDEIMAELQNIGVVTLSNVPRDGVIAWARPTEDRAARVEHWLVGGHAGAPNMQMLCILVNRRWAGMNYQTARAAMDPARRGIFHSSGSHGALNIPDDIVGSWMNGTVETVTGVVDAFLQELRNLQLLGEQWLERPPDVDAWLRRELSGLAQSFGMLRQRAIFRHDMMQRLRQHMAATGVFREGRRLPTAQELQDAFHFLCRDTIASLRAMSQLFARTRANFLNRVEDVETLNAPTKRRLELAINACRHEDGNQSLDSDGVPHEFQCPVSLQMMDDPVKLLCCSARLERTSLATEGRMHLSHCPLCRAVIPEDAATWVVDAPLLQRINAFTEVHAPPDPAWYVGVWEEYVRERENSRALFAQSQ